MDSVGTQETQDASQAYMTRPDDDLLDSNCWGLLWPIEDKRQTDGPAAPWRFNKDKNRYTLGRGPNCDVKVVSQIISEFFSCGHALLFPLLLSLRSMFAKLRRPGVMTTHRQ